MQCESGCDVMNSHLPDEMKTRSRPSKTILSRLNSSSQHEEIEIKRRLSVIFRAAWHYLVSTESKLCVDITREFLRSHKNLWVLWQISQTNTGRKAIHVALPEQREEIEKLLLLCGRYRINPVPSFIDRKHVKSCLQSTSRTRHNQGRSCGRDQDDEGSKSVGV